MHRRPRTFSGFSRGAILTFAMAGIVTCGGGNGGENPPGATAPLITTQPADTAVLTGQTATFTVTASGTAPLSYQWRKDGVNLASGGASYTTPGTTSADNGSTFSVVVTNTAGLAESREATLIVTATAVAPTISTHPANATVTAGHTATFTVAASGTAPLSYQWKRDGANVGSDATSYTTPATTTADSGATFTVTVTNAAGHADSSQATLTVNPASTSTVIVADHTVVDRYGAIPQTYLDLVKKMWFDLPGESHSSGYRHGLQFLAEANSKFAVSITENGSPEASTSQHLRASRAYRSQSGAWSYGSGETNWYTNASGIAETKAHLDYCHANALAPAAMGFGWCWDMSWNNDPGGTVDPVYKVHWAGSSEGGPQGNLRWGLDAGDQALTGNAVCMDTYLAATQAYADHCTSNGYATKVFFTTGPVDSYSGENGYQRQLKHDHIRTYVAANGSRMLFDYADILAWSDAGAQNVQTWTDGEGGVHTYQMIHSDNMLDRNGSYSEDGDHIGERGALRLGKAVWWMLARMAGWDGQ